MVLGPFGEAEAKVLMMTWMELMIAMRMAVLAMAVMAVGGDEGKSGRVMPSHDPDDTDDDDVVTDAASDVLGDSGDISCITMVIHN